MSKSLRHLMALCLVLAVPSFARDFKVTGYVHNARAGSFELSGFHVECASDVILVPPEGADSGRIPANCGGIRVGDHLRVTGEVVPGSTNLKATKIVIDPITANAKIRGFALIERAPRLARNPNGWTGELYADGRVLTVSSATKITFEQPDKDPVTGKQAPPIQSLDQVGPNVFAAYEAIPSYEGKLDATQLIISPNDTTQAEQDFRKKETPQIQEPDYNLRVQGDIKIDGKSKFVLHPHKGMQERVKTIGAALLPEFQRRMPDNDPDKLHFQFWVIQTKGPTMLSSSNGLVLISDIAVTRMKTDAQLAAMLSFLVAEVVQEQEFLHRDRRKLQNFLGWTTFAGSFLNPAASVAGVVNGGAYSHFMRLQNEQAVRVGMDYMQQAGFDIREVGPAWAAVRDKSLDAGDAQVALGRYALDEIRRYHLHDNFDSLKLNFADTEASGAPASN